LLWALCAVLAAAYYWYPMVLRLQRYDGTVDLAVYATALWRMAQGAWDPLIPFLGTTLWQRSVEPVLWLLAPICRVMDPVSVLVGMDVVTALGASVPLLWLHRKGVLSGSVTLLAVGLITCIPAVTRPLTQPGHPGAWAVFPMMCVGACARMGNGPGVLVWSLVLLAFGDRHGLAVLGLGLAALMTGKRRLAVGALVASMAMGILVIALKPSQTWVLVERLDQAGVLLAPYMTKYPWEEMKRTFLPLGALFLWVAVSRRKPDKLLMGMWIPLVAMRVLEPRWWEDHHVAIVAGCSLMMVLPLGSDVRVPRWVFPMTVVITTYWNGHLNLEQLAVFAGGPPRAVANEQRLHAVNAAMLHLEAHPDDGVLTMPHLLAFLATRPVVGLIGGSEQQEQTYRYVLVEKAGEDLGPLDRAAHDALITKWRSQPEVYAVVDTPYVLLLEGAFYGAKPRGERP
jgi:hypothetical protein